MLSTQRNEVRPATRAFTTPEISGQFYTRLFLKGISCQELHDLYVRWLLGEPPFRRIRERRLCSGIESSWTIESLQKPGNYSGHLGTELRIRIEAGVHLIEFTQLDQDLSRTIWKTLVRFSPDERGVKLEHGVRLVRPAGGEGPAILDTPAILKWLFDQQNLRVLPRELGQSGTVLRTERDVERFVRHHLLSNKRRVPIVLVTPSNGTGTPWVSPSEVAEKLRALAKLFYVTDKKLTFCLTDLLAQQGFPRAFSCFDGGVRLYLPSVSSDELPHRHRLWLGSNLAGIADGCRNSKLSSEIIAAISQWSSPPGYWHSINELDRASNAERATSILRHLNSITPPSEIGPVQGATVSVPDRRISDLSAELQNARAEIDQALLLAHEEEQAKRHAEEDKSSLLQQLEERNESLLKLQKEVQRKGDELERRSSDIARLKQGKLSVGINDETRDSLIGVIEQSPSPRQSLTVIGAMFPSRVEILPSAISSAADIEGIRKDLRYELFELLWILASQYHQEISAGRPDKEARRVFGNIAYAAKESETTMNNPECIRQRTFKDANGKQYVLWAHLKLGKKSGYAETVRIHFQWDSEKGRIVIGHCGRHLKIAGGK